MIFLVHSETTADTLLRNLGQSEYSYYFVLKEFRPVLDSLGLVVPIADPLHEAGRVCRAAAARGEECCFLSFSPPHRTPLVLDCPTIPVFAWEFDTLPCEAWGEDPRQDWRFLLGSLGRGITHSSFAVATTRRAMGAGFPIVSIPAPVWDRYGRSPVAPPNLSRRVLPGLRGRVLDTRTVDLAPHMPRARREQGPVAVAAARPDQATRVELDGVVYTSVFNPTDGRKNWFDMICAFVWALRDAVDATLVLKLTNHDCSDALLAMLGDLAKLQPFRCRVLLMDGHLDDADYDRLVLASTYVLNTSHGEGQCLPLMEFMSAGKPAVCPGHTAMADYTGPDNAFIVRSHLEPTHWPHDPRQVYRTLRHRIDFASLVAALHDSYRVARHDATRYAAMSRAAQERLRSHCSQAVTRQRLQDFLDMPGLVNQPGRLDRVETLQRVAE